MTDVLGTLVTYADGPQAVRSTIAQCRDLGLPLIVDSGAWSVSTGTAQIDVDEHAAFVRDNDDTAGVRFIGLDVIGDAEASFRNWERQRADGAHVEPTIHYGTHPDAVTRYVDAGLVSPWFNLGGIVKASTRAARDVVGWAAAVKRRLPPGTLLHGLGCTSPRPNRWFPFDAVDSSYWVVSLVRYRMLPLFDDRTGDWVKFPVAQTNPDGRAAGWAQAHRHGRFLREQYGAEPRAVLDGTDDYLLGLSLRSHVKFSQYYRRHHGSDLTVYLAGSRSLEHAAKTLTPEGAAA